MCVGSCVLSNSYRHSHVIWLLLLWYKGSLIKKIAIGVSTWSIMRNHPYNFPNDVWNFTIEKSSSANASVMGRHGESSLVHHFTFFSERRGEATLKAGGSGGTLRRTAALAFWPWLSVGNALRPEGFLFSILRQFLPGLWDFASPARHTFGNQHDGPQSCPRPSPWDLWVC